MFNCPNCDYSNDSLNSLRIHASKSHKISSEELYLNVYDKTKPLCLCGCGNNTKFKNLFEGYNDYVLGHASRIKNNWGHNEKAQEKSQEKRREMWKNGEIKHWCEGLTIEDPRIQNLMKKVNTPERAKKISKSLKGVPKSEIHKEKIKSNMQKYWSSEINRSFQSERQAICVMNGMLTKATKVYGYYENPTKSKKPKVYYRSNFELNAIKYFEENDSILSYEIEPLRISYDYDGKIRNYILDFAVEKNDGNKVLIEIKPSCYTNYKKYKVNEAKFEAAKKFALENGYEFEIWTEKTHSFLSNSNKKS
jgi:hypothetical protein